MTDRVQIEVRVSDRVAERLEKIRVEKGMPENWLELTLRHALKDLEKDLEIKRLLDVLEKVESFTGVVEKYLPHDMGQAAREVAGLVRAALGRR